MGQNEMSLREAMAVHIGLIGGLLAIPVGAIWLDDGITLTISAVITFITIWIITYFALRKAER
jgi:hypothetical protein